MNDDVNNGIVKDVNAFSKSNTKSYKQSQPLPTYVV